MANGNSTLVWLRINGTVPPVPKSFTPVYSDFDSPDSERNENGILHRTVIRTGQVAPKYQWRINTTELNALLNMIEPEQLTVEYFDPKLMGYKTFTGYAQATRQPKLVLQKDTFADCLWDFECSFIEY